MRQDFRRKPDTFEQIKKDYAQYEFAFYKSLCQRAGIHVGIGAEGWLANATSISSFTPSLNRLLSLPFLVSGSRSRNLPVSFAHRVSSGAMPATSS